MYNRNYNILSEKHKEFFIPTLLLSLSMYAANFADEIISGNLIGSNALAAVALVIPLTTLFCVIYWIFGLGGSVLASTSKAERNQGQANEYFTISMVSLLIVGIIIAILGNYFLSDIVYLLSHNGSLAPYVSDYAQILILGTPITLITFGVTYFMRADGEPNLATMVLLSSNILNVILDFVYIQYFHWGISGAALATITGYAVGLIFIVKYLISKYKKDEFTSIFKLKVSKLLEILKSGFAPASGQIFILIKIFFINSLILVVLGEPGNVAFALCFNCLIIISIPVAGVNQTLSPLVSVFYKEKDYMGVKYIMKRSFKILLVTGLAITIFIIMFPGVLLAIFGVNDPTTIIIATNALRIFSLSMLGLAISFAMIFYFQAIGRKTFALAISITEGILIIIPSSLILLNLIGVDGIWLAFSVAEIVTLVMIYIVSKIVAKKSDGKYSGILLLGQNKDTPVFDVTIEGSLKDAVGLSEKIMDFAEKNGVDKKASLYIGISVEEMVVNTINYNSDFVETNIEYIDILSEIGEKEIIISFKDTGVEYDPTTYVSGEKESFESIDMLKSIASNISYARLLGLNSTIITIKRN